MKTVRLPVLLTVALLVLQTGCETGAISGRIQEKSAAFGQLTPAQQDNVRQGIIEVGYTSDMVYMALGHPSKSSVRQTPDGPVGIWIYEQLYPADPVVKMMPAQNSMAYAPPMVSAQAPFRTGFRSPGFGAAPPGNYGPQQAMEPADLAAETLYVLFYQGRVFEIKLAGREG